MPDRNAADEPVARGILVGLGTMGSYHLRVLLERPDVDVVATVDPDSSRRAAAERRTSAPSFATLADALGSVTADFACVAAPADKLAALAHEALAAGMAVLVEKPLADDEAAALAVVRDAETRGLLLAAGHVERCNPAVMALRQRLARGDAGRVYQVHARRLSPYPGRESKTGVALDLATHDLDVIRYLTGSDVARVYAEIDEREPNGAEDLLSASLRLESGATGVLEVNWLTPAKVRELTVTAEAGTFVVDYLTQDLSFYENPRAEIEWEALRMMRGTGMGDMTRYAIDRREPLAVEWELFLDALRTGAQPAATGWDGYVALSTARAIQRSGREHRAVVPLYREAEDALARTP